MKKAVTYVFGMACGAIVGFALGVMAAMALGLWSRWMNPNDPSAGSAAIVVIATAPGGAVLGSVFGAITIASRPRLFLATFLPLAIFFVGLQSTLSTLRRMDRPRSFVLEVNGTPAAEFVAIISVDGDVKQMTGQIPAKFEFDALRLEAAFALAAANGEHIIAVQTSADGRDLETGIESQLGVQLELESVGYSESFGGTSRKWGRMSPKDVERLLHEGSISREF